MKYILFLFISTSLFCQNLSVETEKYLQELVKNYPDSLKSYDKNKIFDIGYKNAWLGYNKRGEELMQYGLKKMQQDSLYQSMRHSSVQNTKNGFFVQAIEKLEKSSSQIPEISGYYGWVLLYYYHDYSRALKNLEIFDNLTPNFVDAPMGECVLFLKGICYMKMENYVKAIEEFNQSEKNSDEHFGKYNYPHELQIYKGRCYEKLNNLNEALKCYDLANKVAKTADGFYYKAIILQKLGKKEEAKINLKQALELIKKCTKSQDKYVEMFDEIYIQDIEKTLVE
ncbi:MAG: hypothetical protein H6604_04830 [Flavobacteriales bacterium]|nr:hypothetical protein [Flavobacteriales bacterium]